MHYDVGYSFKKIPVETHGFAGLRLYVRRRRLEVHDSFLLTSRLRIPIWGVTWFIWPLIWRNLRIYVNDCIVGAEDARHTLLEHWRVHEFLYAANRISIVEITDREISFAPKYSKPKKYRDLVESLVSEILQKKIATPSGYMTYLKIVY